VTKGRPRISRQDNIKMDLIEILCHVDSMLVNDSVNTFLNNEYTGNNWITFVSMQRVVNTAIEEEVFSMWFTYIHCWATGVFSMDPARDCICNPVVNQKSVIEREREWSESSAVKEEGFGLLVIVIDCD
jgi:hypothetical protein